MLPTRDTVRITIYNRPLGKCRKKNGTARQLAMSENNHAGSVRLTRPKQASKHAWCARHGTTHGRNVPLAS